MRALLLGVMIAFVVAAVGAGIAIDPLIAGIAGAVAVCGVALLGFSTDRIAWLAACLLALTITWNGIRVGGGAAGNLVMIMAFGAMVAHALLSRRSPAAPPTLLLAATGLMFATLLTLMFPPSFALTNLTDVELHSLLVEPALLVNRSNVVALIEVELSFVVIPLVMIAAGSTPRRCRVLIDFWTVGVVASAVVGFIDTVGIAHIAPTPLTSGTRSAGLTIHPNYLALGASMAIPTAMLWIGRSTRWTLAGVLGTAALLGGVYASGSRAGAVGAVVAVFATALVIPRLRRFALIGLPVAGMIAIALLFLTSAGDDVLNQVRLDESGARDLSVQGSNFQRSMQAHIAWDQFMGRPLQGVGFSVISDAHSIYLQLLAAGGVIALISFFVFVGGIVGAVMRGLSGPMRSEVAAGGLAVLVWLANGVVDNQVADKYLFVMPGIIYAMARLSPGQRPALARPRPAPVRELVPV